MLAAAMNQEEREALQLLQQQSGVDSCSRRDGANSYNASDVDNNDGEDGNGDGGSDESTQFDGASAEWSDTASYTSDKDDGNDDLSKGSVGGGRSGGGGDTSRPPEIYRSGRAGRANRLSTSGRRRPASTTSSRSGGGDATGNITTAAARRKQRGQGRERGPDAGYVEDIDSTTSSSDAAANSEDNSDDDSDDNSQDDSSDDADDPLEPIQGEVKLVPSMFPDRPPTVFFEYPKELGMARFNNVYFSEPLGARRLLFKSHWERNSVKNAFFRAGFSRTRSTMSWTASWGKHPTREGFRCGTVRYDPRLTSSSLSMP